MLFTYGELDMQSDISNIEEIIIEAVKEINEELENPNLAKPNGKTKLFGAAGNLDSLGLVNLISTIEERVGDEFDQDITLADERAMSQQRSPFRNIETLAAYIKTLLEEEGDL